MAEQETGTSGSSKKSAPAKKSATKKTTATRPRSRTSDTAAKAEPGRRARTGAAQVANAAARQLLELTGKQSEGVTGIERSDDGWTVRVEVVELSRVPNSTDVLGTYEVQVDGDGELQGYRRVRRYPRGVPGEE